MSKDYTLAKLHWNHWFLLDQQSYTAMDMLSTEMSDHLEIWRLCARQNTT